MKIAPAGAVMTTAKTAHVSMMLPNSSYDSIPSCSDYARTIPPKAACTVALGIHAKPINALSLVLYFFSNVTTNVATHRQVTPMRITPSDIARILVSSFEKSTAAPTVPKRNG